MAFVWHLYGVVCLLIADETGKGGQRSLHSTVWGQHCLGTALFEDSTGWGQHWLGTALFQDSTVWGQHCLEQKQFEVVYRCTAEKNLFRSRQCGHQLMQINKVHAAFVGCVLTVHASQPVQPFTVHKDANLHNCMQVHC